MKNNVMPMPCAPKRMEINVKWEMKSVADGCLDKNTTDEYFVCLEKMGENI